MNEITAFSLIENYINGWKQNNIDEIIGCLSENIVIIESHGPVYKGISAINNWFSLWLKANSKIIKWDIISLYFCEKDQVTFYEWDFVCISSEKKYQLSGVSIVKFFDQKINFIHEYRMTKPPYIWNECNLNSE